MSCIFSVCTSDMQKQRYIEFLLEHYEGLRLPYPFPVSFSYMVSPILMQHGSILCRDKDDQRIIGAVGYIVGTGEKEYQDTHVVQIQTAFLLERYRSSRIFFQGVAFLTNHFAQQTHDVSEIRFFAPGDERLHRLFCKISERIATRETEFGLLDEYRATFQQWQSLVERNAT